MIYKIASRFFYVIGIVYMFVPMFFSIQDTGYYFIPGGMVVSMAGIMLMGGLEENKGPTNENILDDGEF